jgi:hypothetical protein
MSGLAPRSVFVIGIAAALSACAGPSVFDTEGEQVGSYRLPRAFIAVTATCPKGKKSDGCTFSYAKDLVVVPDGRRKPYKIHYQPAATSADRIELTAPNGLLKKIDSVADDKSAGTIVAVAKSLGAASALFAQTPTGKAQEPTAEARADTETSTFFLDPADPKSVKAFKLKTESMGIDATIEPLLEDKLDESECEHDFCYAVPTSVSIAFSDKAGHSASFIASVPDPTIHEGVDVKRSAFVNRKTTVDFDCGSWLKTVVDKPSETLAIASVPADAIDAFLDATLGTLTKIITNKNKEVELIKARTAEINALTEYRRALTTAKAAESGAAEPAVPNKPGDEAVDAPDQATAPPSGNVKEPDNPDTPAADGDSGPEPAGSNTAGCSVFNLYSLGSS